MTYKIIIKPSNVEFTCDSGQTILSAAIEQGIMLPFRCKVGACMTCICKMIEGDVEYQLEPMLTNKERQQGWIFPCQAYAKSHLILTFEE